MPAASTGALPNALEVERLHPVDWEPQKQVEQRGVKKPALLAPAPAPPFSAGAGALPNGLINGAHLRLCKLHSA